MTGKSWEMPKNSYQFSDTLGYVERILPTTNNIRSHRCDCLIIDETASIPTPIIKTSIPLLKNPIAKLIWISTPHKERSLFNDYVANTPSDWVLLQYSSELAEWTSKMRETAKETLTPEEYEIEINAQIPKESIKTLLSSKDIEACIENFINISGLPDNKLSLSIDWGYGRSKTVACLVESSKAYKFVIKLWYWDNSNIDKLFPELGAIINDYYKLSNETLRVVCDSKPIEFLTDLKKYTSVYVKPIDKSQILTNAESNTKVTIKDLLIRQVYHGIKLHHIRIPASEELLIKELRGYTRDRVYNCDAVDSLMMAIGELPKSIESHNVVIFNKVKFDHYFTQKWRDPSGINSFKKGY
jgi:hypothetical protein